jgi:hypothetical protein
MKGGRTMKRNEMKDLPKHQELTKAEMNHVMGGIDTVPLPERTATISYPKLTRYSFSPTFLQRSSLISAIPINIP